MSGFTPTDRDVSRGSAEHTLRARRAPRGRALALAIFASSLLSTAPAFAQELPGIQNPPASPAAADLDKAREHMAAGAAFFTDPAGKKLEEAFREYKRAYELSGSKKALRSAGICALELERDGEAIALFEKFVALNKPESDEQVERDLRTLKASVAWVTIRTNLPNARIVDVRTPSRGLPLKNNYPMAGTELKIGMHAGEHTITASAEGMPELTWKVEISTSGTYDHAFEFKPAAAAPAVAPTNAVAPIPQAPDQKPETHRPVPVTVYALGGLTVALAVPTVIFMAGASGAKSDFDAMNGKAPANVLEDQRSTVESKNLLADVFLGATVASGAATAILFFTRPEKAKPQTGQAHGRHVAPRKPASKVQVLPVVAPSVGKQGGQVGLHASGRF